jgi:starch-binding outer membrane protein, SusD/RagB family
MYFFSHSKTSAVVYWCFLMIGWFLFSLISGCKKFIDVSPPITTTNASNIYEGNTTAAAVLTGIYSVMSSDEIDNKGLAALNNRPSLSADELTLIPGYGLEYVNGYYKNALKASYESEFWFKTYNLIFITNSALEGLNNSTRLTSTVKNRLLGEAYFIRAFCYFNLVNLYGDVPLALTTDYKVNSVMPRIATSQIYTQIKDDLIKAQSLLAEEYMDGTLLNSTNNRVRPNKYAAIALLSRIYLYTKDWENAEAQATLIIERNSLYDTVPLDEVFLMNSKETIWSLQPTGNSINSNTGSGRLFILPSTGPNNELNYLYLNDDLVNSFEANDSRRNKWINSITVSGTTYDFPFKYRIGSMNAPTQEFSIILRLAEQYLIRAESRAKQGKLTGTGSAQSDINIIRLRTGLSNITATSQSDFLNAILDERRHELFTEWGHRWFDLKRTQTVDSVMAAATAKKGGTWKSSSALYPIPAHEIQSNPNLIQNTAY